MFLPLHGTLQRRGETQVPEQSLHRLADEFGGNEWLVNELYEKYRHDNDAVDKKWWPLFAALDAERAPLSHVAANAPQTPSAAPPPRSSTTAPTTRKLPAVSLPNPTSPQSAPTEREPSPQSGTPAPGTPAPETTAPETTALSGNREQSITAEAAQPKAQRAPVRPTVSGAPTAQVSQETARSSRRSASPTSHGGTLHETPPKRKAEHTTPSSVPPRSPSPTASPKAPTASASASASADTVLPLRGPAKAIATNMGASLSIPTATSVRAIPAKLLIDNRLVINSNLSRAQGGKVSFTHLIGYALLRALRDFPSMNAHYEERDGKPCAVQPGHVNLGIAIDLPRPDGSRLLVVPNVKRAETLSFAAFWRTYESLVQRARQGKLTPDDSSGTTLSLTNPGGLGTVHSVPRLSQGQSCIIGVGALEYPAEFQGASEEIIAKNAVSKIFTLTSTYDHRVIQGAESGEFLRRVHHLLLGAENFYDEIFEDLRIPYEPVRWSLDVQVDPLEQINKVARIQQLIHAYRVRGHLMAATDPLEYAQRHHPDLDVINHGLTLWDLDREWPTGGFGGKPSLKFRDILSVLRDAYCRTTGVEYMHLQEPEQREWFQDELEHPYSKPSREEQLRIVAKLNAAEAFETFLQTKFVGQKRFSLEGGEALIPMLDSLLSDAADDGCEEVAIGMAHRGRLNVLTNIAGKTYAQVFREFEGTQDFGSIQGSGDVKYHLGTEGSFTSDKGNTTQVYLAANPSHLEAVDAVLEGIVRAKEDRLDRGTAFPVLPIAIHGDAAFAGQGVVAETLNLSQLRGYRTGGTIHIVVNNQIGFTTAPSASRSSVYATDIARMIQSPIFHVNADDPEAVVRVAQIAYRFRQRFHKDVVLDLVCYRRRGHNESDDPSMTQPLMYDLIQKRRSVRRLYTESLIGRGDITEEEAEQLFRDYRERLERVFAETHAAQTSPIPVVTADAQAVADLERPIAQQSDTGENVPGSTAITADMLAHIGRVYASTPEDFTVHPKLVTLLERRERMALQGSIDWGFGEIAALGSLLMEGVPVRLTGQDSRRGTFAQRHAVFHDRINGQEWSPLSALSPQQAKLWIYDSLLSEYAAMAFEYGYSVERPDALVLWEAQFGDFANGAQTVIDEFISSAEQKWGQRSSLTLLLPHGYEGQGPDHSSARIERYLQLCAEMNMVVAQPSTPASYFHLLRRQAYAKPRKPLIVFTPKQLLRLKAASSAVEDFTSGEFSPLLDDTVSREQVRRVVLVSGRLYYDLIAHRTSTSRRDVALVRLEQLYPLPLHELRQTLAQYPQGAELVFAQDEPWNQGPWPYLAFNLAPQLDRPLRVIARPPSAATATGSAKRHAFEQETLLANIFAD